MQEMVFRTFENFIENFILLPILPGHAPGPGAPRGGVDRATAPGPVRGPRLQSEMNATDNTRLIDD